MTLCLMAADVTEYVSLFVSDGYQITHYVSLIVSLKQLHHQLIKYPKWNNSGNILRPGQIGRYFRQHLWMHFHERECMYLFLSFHLVTVSSFPIHKRTANWLVRNHWPIYAQSDSIWASWCIHHKRLEMASGNVVILSRQRNQCFNTVTS